MIGAGEPRDLAARVVPRVGWLEPADDPWEPWRLCDAAGAVVVPVAAYLRDLQAAGRRPETTLRTYSIALLRWFRFLWAAGVAWDQATRAEARDFCRWIQLAAKPAVRRSGDRALVWAVPGPGRETR
ncbi:MAG TPA: site-specific integrase [Streptosporangiaceae bacterium]